MFRASCLDSCRNEMESSNFSFANFAEKILVREKLHVRIDMTRKVSQWKNQDMSPSGKNNNKKTKTKTKIKQEAM